MSGGHPEKYRGYRFVLLLASRVFSDFDALSSVSSLFGMGGASGKVAKLLHGGADQKLFEEIFKRFERFVFLFLCWPLVVCSQIAIDLSNSLVASISVVNIDPSSTKIFADLLQRRQR